MRYSRGYAATPFGEASQLLYDVATVATVGATGFAVLDALANKKDIVLPVAAFLPSSIF
jgi:hypothetical protein